MWQQMKQVWMTYYTYLTQTWVMCLLVVFALNLIMLVPLTSTLAADSSHPTFGQPLQLACGAGSLLLTYWLVTMAKWHYSHPGARLIPGYQRAHSRLLLALLVAYFVLHPLGIAWFGGFPAWNMMAFMIAIAAVAAWFTFERNSVLSWLPLLLYFSVYTPWGEAFWAATDTGPMTLKLAILFVGWTVMLTWMWRLPKLEFETPEYGQGGWELLNVSSRWWQRRQEKQAAAKLSRGALKARIVDHWHDRISNPVYDSRRTSNWLLRYGFDEFPIVYRVARSVAALGLLVLFTLTLNTVFLSRAGSTGELSFHGLWYFLIIPVFMPGPSASMKMEERRRQLKNELLYPMSRQEMIDGLFRSLSIESAFYWIGLHLSLFILVLVVMPSLLQPEMIGAFVFLSLMLQPLMFYVSLLMCGNLEEIGPKIGGLFSAVVACALIIPWWSQRANLGDGVFILIAMGLGVLGIWCGTRVRSIWTRLEFG